MAKKIMVLSGIPFAGESGAIKNNPDIRREAVAFGERLAL